MSSVEQGIALSMILFTWLSKWIKTCNSEDKCQGKGKQICPTTDGDWLDSMEQLSKSSALWELETSCKLFGKILTIKPDSNFIAVFRRVFHDEHFDV